MRPLVLVFLLILAFVDSATAQNTHGRLQGRVVDSDGRPIATVDVSVRSPSLQGERHAETNVNGFFTFRWLPVGTYSVRLQRLAYETRMLDSVTVRLGRTTTVGEVRLIEAPIEVEPLVATAQRLLIDPELPETYSGIVRKYGLETSSFTFEVAEQDVLNSDAPHLRVLGRLRDRGFRLSLDDFGVAASSLSAFEQLPFDEIKVHAAALARAQANPVAKQVLAAVTGLAHNLGISVCAEGVEDEATFEFLKTIECDKMQGFLISEAVMPDIIRRVYSPKSNNVEDVA